MSLATAFNDVELHVESAQANEANDVVEADRGAAGFPPCDGGLGGSGTYGQLGLRQVGTPPSLTNQISAVRTHTQIITVLLCQQRYRKVSRPTHFPRRLLPRCQSNFRRPDSRTQRHLRIQALLRPRARLLTRRRRPGEQALPGRHPAARPSPKMSSPPPLKTTLCRRVRPPRRSRPCRSRGLPEARSRRCQALRCPDTRECRVVLPAFGLGAERLDRGSRHSVQRVGADGDFVQLARDGVWDGVAARKELGDGIADLPALGASDRLLEAEHLRDGCRRRRD